MSIVTTSKQASTALETAVKDFLRQADITVVPTRGRKGPTKGQQAARARAIAQREKELAAKERAEFSK